MISRASSVSRRCSTTRSARWTLSIRRDMSWRAGMDRNARVSSIMPDVFVNPAGSVIALRNRLMASGASTNHHGTPTNIEG